MATENISSWVTLILILERIKTRLFLNGRKVKNKTGMQQTTRSANLNEVSFQPLPYTKEELKDIGEIIGEKNCEIYTGKNALEEILMNKPATNLCIWPHMAFF